MTKILAIAIALTGFAITAPAFAHRMARPYVWDGPEASGCYYSRGERYCGRYCYIEINGKRYCQPRERDAYPQGEIYIEDQVVLPGRSHRHRHQIK